MICSPRAVLLAKEERVRCVIDKPRSKSGTEAAVTDVVKGLHGLIKHMYGIDVLGHHLWLGLTHDLDNVWVEGGWSPRTDAVVLVGGPEDGLMFSHPGAPRKELRRVHLSNPLFLRTPAEGRKPTEEVETHVIDYQYAGWSDTQHAWAYSPT